MQAKLKSRKFWVAVVGAVLVVLNQGLDLGVNEEAVGNFANIIIGYLIAEGAADAVGSLRRSK
ncbi:MAG: hypothetical protein JW730_18270 [Anaerolineales bacterium]|nr:hypothetical protein [Anaerolineales bacterium]